MQRLSPNFRIALIVLTTAACLVYLLLTITDTALRYHMRSITEPTPVARDWRPDISHCLDESVVTWDCIRSKGD